MRERTTVLCWLWSQPGAAVKYGAAHVNIWHDMISRNLTIEHDVACVTNMSEGIDPRVRIIVPPDEFLDVEMPTWKAHRPQCLRRLSMYRRDAAEIFGCDRIVCTDLDVIFCGSLDPLLDIKDDFCITRGTAENRVYNGSFQLLRLGSRPKVYEEFTPQKAIRAGRYHLGSDQAWLAHCIPYERTWGPGDGVRFWGQHRPVSDARAIFFAGPIKPWHLSAAGEEALVTMHYRRSSSGAALLLGHGATLWSDLDVALARGERFDAVIASPEAAAYWPGKVLAIADDDAHAERLAAMHGFEPLWCGRSVEELDVSA